MNAYMNWHAQYARSTQEHNSLILNYTTKKPVCQWESMVMVRFFVNFLSSWPPCRRVCYDHKIDILLKAAKPYCTTTLLL